MVNSIHCKPRVVMIKTYSQASNISRYLVGNKIVEHSDVAGALPVGNAPTTSSFSTQEILKISILDMN